VSDFRDVEQFGREHRDCGGITPTAVAQEDGGFVLTLTCACGAFLDRWITAEDANHPLPLPEELIVPAAPSPAPAPPPPGPRAAPRRTVAPSADYDAVLRAAIEAEEAAPPARPAAPPPSAPKRPAPPPAAPVPAPSSELTTLVRELRAKPPGSDASRARSGPAKLNLDATIDTALSEQDARARNAVKRPRDYRILWLLLVVLVTIGAATGIYVVTGPDAPPVPLASAPPARPPEQQRRAEFDEVMKSLRQLQRVSSPGMDPSVYSSRVIFAKVDAERFMAEAPPGPSRSGVREVLDVHVLADAALKARELRQKEVWEALGRDPAIDLCPAVRTAVDAAEAPANVSRAQARGLAVAAAIPLLWECAAEKIAALEAAPAQ